MYFIYFLSFFHFSFKNFLISFLLFQPKKKGNNRKIRTRIFSLFTIKVYLFINQSNSQINNKFLKKNPKNNRKSENLQEFALEDFSSTQNTILFGLFLFHFFAFISFISISLNIKGEETLMNTNFELSMPGFMNIDFENQIRKEEKIGGGGSAITYRGVITDPKLTKVYFFSFFFFSFLFFPFFSFSFYSGKKKKKKKGI